MKTVIKIIIIVFLSALIIYHFFFYADIKNSCYIKILPSLTELSSSNIKKGINVLKNAAPEEYEKLCGNIDTINPNFSCGGFQGGCYTYTPRQIDISTSRDEFLGWTAAIIAHETCHAIQHSKGQELNEDECYTLDDMVLQKVVEY